jgi:hypothetical protein
MLHIRYNNQGKAEYAFGLNTDAERQNNENNQNNEGNQNQSNVILTPRVQNNRFRKKIDDWHQDNIHHISHITKIYIHALHEFCSLNPQYVCSVKEKEIRCLIVRMLHDCSHNAFKNYPSL